MPRSLTQTIWNWYTVSNLSGGMNNGDADHQLLDGQAVDIENFDLTTRGRIKCRLGSDVLNSAVIYPVPSGAISATSAPIRGLYRYYNAAETNPWVAVCSGWISYGTTSMSAYCASAAAIMTNGGDVQFTTFKDYLFMVDGSHRYYTRLSAFAAGFRGISSWTGSPSLQTVGEWNDMLWGVPAGSAYLIRHTASAGCAHTWNAADYVIVGRQDGGSIVAHKPLFGNYVILKDTGIYVLAGTHPDNYQLERMSEHGCIARGSVVANDAPGGGIIYLAADGVRIFDGATSHLLSESDTFTIDILGAMNTSNLSKVTAEYFDRKYIMVYDDIATTTSRNNAAWVFNFRAKGWTKYTNFNAASLFKTKGADEDVDLYFGSSVSGYIFQALTGTTDYSGTSLSCSISAVYDTKEYDMSDRYKNRAQATKQFGIVKVTGNLAYGSMEQITQVDRGASLSQLDWLPNQASGGFQLDIDILVESQDSPGGVALGSGVNRFNHEVELGIEGEGKTISTKYTATTLAHAAEIDSLAYGFQDKTMRG